MRVFHSYGPVDSEEHFCHDRKELVNRCTKQLIGNSEKGGHFFTVWAPRQTGKTWLIRQSIKDIKKLYCDSFLVGELSMQGINFEENDDNSKLTFFKRWQSVIYDEFDINIEKLDSWEDWLEQFSRKRGIFDKTLILIIDEFDKLPKHIIDRVISMFRDMYQKRKNYMLHGLALIGVRAVLGVESDSGSPFNIQRSLHIPNFTFKEVRELFHQYQEESGQKINPYVIDKMFEMTNGQPGLIGWLGELLTDPYKYNPGYDTMINIKNWNTVKRKALFNEPNNTMINLIAKAKKPEYSQLIMDIFSNPNISFSFHDPLLNYLYMHGVIDSKTVENEYGEEECVRFSSPFVQQCLFYAFGRDATNTLKQTFFENNVTIMAIEPMDTLDDVFSGEQIDTPALLKRYIDYLIKLKEKGINPWRDQPRRKTDFHLTEAVGHFHLYHWLQIAVGRRCSVNPEFPTGSGKVDLHLQCGEKKSLIEVKSFQSAYDLKEACKQAAKYAEETNHYEITIAMFAPFSDEKVLQKISVKEKINGVNVTVIAIGQGG